MPLVARGRRAGRRTMARPFAFSIVIALFARAAFAQSSLCSRPHCECAPAAHPSWTTVNCTVPSDQKLYIHEGDLPESTTDLIISGAEAVMFNANSLSRLKDARRITLDGAKLVLLRKFAAVNLNVINVYLEIQGSDVLRIEERAFTNIKGPLSVFIDECDAVSIEGEAFSWLLSLRASNVRQMQLSPGAFMLDPTAANVGEHGPGMTIELNNMTIPEFTSQTFGSSAASIIMRSVVIQAIHAEAFSANTYNVVQAINCTIDQIDRQAFAQKSLINHLLFIGCKIKLFGSKALQSAVGNLNISHTTIENVETEAINITVATVTIEDSEFYSFSERGFGLSSWNKLTMERNKFDDLGANAIVAPGVSIHELIFVENEVETMSDKSLGFIGQTQVNFASKIQYKNNYFGQPCKCALSTWLLQSLDTETKEPFITSSYCTVDEILARCFNVHDQNMIVKHFIDEVCIDESTIKCEPFKTKTGSGNTEIKNPRFPHKGKDRYGLSDRNKKVIGIVVVTALGCTLIVMFVSLIRWMRRRGHCVNVKNLVISSNSACASMCDRLFSCGGNTGLDNARSISQLSVNEYSERHRLNEPRIQEMIQETTLPDMYTEDVTMEDKTTQTLPEELTKELLENLKEKLEDPENYVEAREMIEHLYELIRIEENCNVPRPKENENIYELPFTNTVPRLGKNKKEMKSVGTKTPSLENLQDPSPYYRKTALQHEYFEPKDFAVHLYAEIANHGKDRRKFLGGMPDVVAEQAVPRGPYLRAKMGSSSSSNASSPPIINSPSKSPQKFSSIKSNKSTSSNTSGKMINRPLPEKPTTFDPGEGTSNKLG